MFEPCFTPFPILNSSRLVLRQLRVEDGPEMFVLRSDPQIRKYIKRPATATLGEAIEFIERVRLQESRNEVITWAITVKGQDTLIGTICFWNIERATHLAEVGYALHYDYFNKGIMSEALAMALAYGFEQMNLKRVDAYTNKENGASRAILTKAGFTRNTAFEAIYENQDELSYNVIYTALKP